VSAGSQEEVGLIFVSASDSFYRLSLVPEGEGFTSCGVFLISELLLVEKNGGKYGRVGEVSWKRFEINLPSV